MARRWYAQDEFRPLGLSAHPLVPDPEGSGRPGFYFDEADLEAARRFAKAGGEAILTKPAPTSGAARSPDVSKGFPIPPRKPEPAWMRRRRPA